MARAAMPMAGGRDTPANRSSRSRHDAELSSRGERSNQVVP